MNRKSGYSWTLEETKLTLKLSRAHFKVPKVLEINAVLEVKMPEFAT